MKDRAKKTFRNSNYRCITIYRKNPKEKAGDQAFYSGSWDINFSLPKGQN